MTAYTTNIEIIQCTCGRLGVAMTSNGESSTRITNHKCSGQWEVLSTQLGIIDTKDLAAEATSELKEVDGYFQWVDRE